MYKWPQFQTCLLCPCETTVSLTQLLCTLRSTVSVSGSEAKRVKIQSIKHIMLSPGGRIRIMKVVGCGAVLAGFIILGKPLHLAACHGADCWADACVGAVGADRLQYFSELGTRNIFLSSRHCVLQFFTNASPRCFFNLFP